MQAHMTPAAAWPLCASERRPEQAGDPTIEGGSDGRVDDLKGAMAATYPAPSFDPRLPSGPHRGGRIRTCGPRVRRGNHSGRRGGQTAAGRGSARCRALMALSAPTGDGAGGQERFSAATHRTTRVRLRPQAKSSPRWPKPRIIRATTNVHPTAAIRKPGLTAPVAT